MAHHTGKEFDITVYGATGFTGRLVAEYLARTYPASSGIRWAMAGRSAEKLAEVRDEIGAPADTPLLVADAGDRSSLEALASQSKVILTTVGPYQLYGNALLAVCAESGTDYVDLCGEPAWMSQKIEQLGDVAKASGARIVFSCGFDSIPFEMGVFFLQQHAMKTLGKPCHTHTHTHTVCLSRIADVPSFCMPLVFSCHASPWKPRSDSWTCLANLPFLSHQRLLHA